MAVADEHGVEVGEQLGEHRLDLAPDRAHAIPQDGVGQDPQVVDLDQERRVAEERHAGMRGAGRRRRGGGTDGAPALVDSGGTVGHARIVHQSRSGAGARLRPRARCRTLRSCRRTRFNRLRVPAPDRSRPAAAPASARGPPNPPPAWTSVPPAPQAKIDREVQRARERAERAARRADRAAGKARDVELRVARKSGSGEFFEAAGDAASAVVTAVSAVADEASTRLAAKARLNALEQALTTARAGGRVDIAPPTRKEALALADRTSPASSAASFVRFAGLVAAGIAAVAMVSIGSFGFLGLDRSRSGC